MKVAATLLLTALAGLAATTPVWAQKSADTLRVGFRDPVSTVDVYQDAKPEIAFSEVAVFDFLVVYDTKTKEYKPDLAVSWNRIDPKTVEFKLRQDIKFHDGSDFTADDVVGTLKYLIDPASNLRFNNVKDWLAGVEKVDKYTVRLIEKNPTPYDLSALTVVPIYPISIFGSFANKSDFGRTHPIGTGPYKVEYVDPNKGIMLVRNEAYPKDRPWHMPGRIGRIHAIPIPDLQTEIAQLVTGGIDLISQIPKDQAEQLATVPDLAVTASQGVVFYFMSMDSVNRSGNAALSNPQVREALEMAVDRQALAKDIVAGGKVIHPIDILCIDTQIGCAGTTKPPAFDVAAAKALLGKAGYPGGFDAEVTSIPGAEAISEAVAGQLEKIGVRTKVDHPVFAAYREKQRAGKLQILVAHWSAGGQPDVATTMDYYFDGGPRDYYHDDIISKLRMAGAIEIDPVKRTDIYRQVFDRVNERHYIMPLTNFPSVFVHTKDLVVELGAINPADAEWAQMHWQ